MAEPRKGVERADAIDIRIPTEGVNNWHNGRRRLIADGSGSGRADARAQAHQLRPLTLDPSSTSLRLGDEAGAPPSQDVLA